MAQLFAVTFDYGPADERGEEIVSKHTTVLAAGVAWRRQTRGLSDAPFSLALDSWRVRRLEGNAIDDSADLAPLWKSQKRVEAVR